MIYSVHDLPKNRLKHGISKMRFSPFWRKFCPLMCTSFGLKWKMLLFSIILWKPHVCKKIRFSRNRAKRSKVSGAVLIIGSKMQNISRVWFIRSWPTISVGHDQILMKLRGNVFGMKRMQTDQYGHMLAHSCQGIPIIQAHIWYQNGSPLPYKTVRGRAEGTPKMTPKIRRMKQ